jgi:3-isopropylmalate dehydrogenase
MLLAVRLMLDWLGEKDRALALQRAVEGVVAEREARTYDLGGGSSTLDVAIAVAKRL